jgi:hypothetical protein
VKKRFKRRGSKASAHDRRTRLGKARKSAAGPAYAARAQGPHSPHPPKGLEDNSPSQCYPRLPAKEGTAHTSASAHKTRRRGRNEGFTNARRALSVERRRHRAPHGGGSSASILSTHPPESESRQTEGRRSSCARTRKKSDERRGEQRHRPSIHPSSSVCSSSSVHASLSTTHSSPSGATPYRTSSEAESSSRPPSPRRAHAFVFVFVRVSITHTPPRASRTRHTATRTPRAPTTTQILPAQRNVHVAAVRARLKEGQAPHLTPLLAPSPANPTTGTRSRLLSFTRYEDERARNPRRRRQRSCPRPHCSSLGRQRQIAISPSSWQPCPQPQSSRRKLRGYEGQGHDPSCCAYGSALAQMHATPELDRAQVAPLYPRGSRTRSAQGGTRSRHLHLHRHNGQEEDSTRALSSSKTRRARRHAREGTHFRRCAPPLSPVPSLPKKT